MASKILFLWGIATLWGIVQSVTKEHEELEMLASKSNGEVGVLAYESSESVGKNLEIDKLELACDWEDVVLIEKNYITSDWVKCLSRFSVSVHFLVFFTLFL